MKIEIVESKIKLNINETKIELTLDEINQLRDFLNRQFPEKQDQPSSNPIYSPIFNEPWRPYDYGIWHNNK